MVLLRLYCSTPSASRCSSTGVVAHDLSVVKHVRKQVAEIVGQIVEMAPGRPGSARRLREVAPGHLARCHLAEELALEDVGSRGPGAMA